VSRAHLATILVLLAAACALTPGSPANLEAAKIALIRTDKDFSKMAQERGIGEAFVAYAAADATMMPANQATVTGREGVRRQFADLTEGTRLIWEPFRADVARSADLGYTLGNYEFHAKGPDGKDVTRYGKYCSVWKKHPDGSWKWVVDIGNASPPPAAVPR
jgi:ketosteroid isomerase-like protein